MSSHRTIVHLVHGTWGRGVAAVLAEERGDTRPAAEPCWFEPGSGFRQALEAGLATEPVEFRSFLWSSSNSFGARTEAAQDLREHLSRAIAQEGDGTVHLIIGHSHAGNVIHEALSVHPGVAGGHRLGGVLTLATPFFGLETVTGHASLLAHGLLPLILLGDTLVLLACLAVAEHWNHLGWWLSTALAYAIAMVGRRRSTFARGLLAVLFGLASIASAVFVARAVLPFFETDFARESLLGKALPLLGLGAAVLLGLANLSLLRFVRRAGQAGPRARLSRDLARSALTLVLVVSLVGSSLALALGPTPAGSWLLSLQAFVPFLALMVGAKAEGWLGHFQRRRAVKVWRSLQEETTDVDLPCSLHAMRLVGDEASLAIVASQLVRAITVGPVLVVEALGRLLAKFGWGLALLVVALGLWVGKAQIDLVPLVMHPALGWALGAVLGVGQVAMLLLVLVLVALSCYLLFCLLAYALVGLAVGEEATWWLPAVTVACEPLPRGPSEKLSLRLIWPDPDERAKLPLRHAMYDLPSVREEVLRWIRRHGAAPTQAEVNVATAPLR